MKNLLIIMALFKIAFISAMDSCRLMHQKQLKIKDAWLPHTILQECKESHVRFSPSGGKIIATAISGGQSRVSIWNQEGKKVFSYTADFPAQQIELNKNETQLFMLSSDGHRLCYNLASNNLLWKGQGADLIFSNYNFSSDETHLLITDWYKAVVIDATTGQDKAILWKHQDQKNNNSISGDFYPHSSQAVVFHNGFLNDKISNDMVAYRALVPVGGNCPLYSRERNQLMYCMAEKLHLVDLATKKEKSLTLCIRKGASFTRVSLFDKGRKLLRVSYSGHRREDFRDNHCWVDVYDIQMPSLIMEIPCDSEPNIHNFNSKRGILLLALRNKLQLWDIMTKSLLWNFDHNDEWLESASINHQGNKVIVGHKNAQVVLWEQKYPDMV